MELKNWAWVCLNQNPYAAPETLHFGLQGEVYGHSTRPNGQPITTSPVVGLGDVPDSVRTKSGSIYVLGEPNAVYEAKFPGGKERLLKSISSRK